MPHFYGYPYHGSGFAGYAGPVVPARIVYNGFGEPVGALPALAALIPSAISALAPLAAKALPAITGAARSAAPGLMRVLPGLLQNLPRPAALPSLPAAPMMPMPVAQPMPVPLPMPMPQPMPTAPYPQPMMMPVRRRRRRRRTRFRRAPGGVARPIAMMPAAPVPVPLPMPVPVPLPPLPAPVPAATDASGGVSGFGYYGYPVGAFHGCARCGGFHGYGRCPF